MSKNSTGTAVTAKPARSMTTKTLAFCALLAALSVVFARLIIPMPNAFTRFSVEAVPIFLAGALFGPLAGGLVGFTADLVGCLFSGYGYNPVFCIPPILYGVCAGLFRGFLSKKLSLPRIFLAFLPAVVFGSILYQSASLSLVYNSKGSFAASMAYFLSTRSIQFAVTIVIDAILVHLLFKTKVFERAGVWPPKLCKPAGE